MKAKLFLHPSKFAYNGMDTAEVFRRKLSRLVDDMRDVVYDNKEENNFVVCSSLFTTPVYEEKTIWEVVFDFLEHDQIDVITCILADTSESQDEISADELESRCCYSANETEVCSMLVINEPLVDSLQRDIEPNKGTIISDYITFEKYSIVYSKDSWLTLRRQILGNHPGDSIGFVEECKSCFPRVAFHENCISSLSDDSYNYLNSCPRKIVYYLSCLNDKFNEEQDKGFIRGKMDPNVLLASFSGKYSFDESGSMQQDYKKKDSLTFEFCITDKEVGTEERRGLQMKKVLCEPHFKIARPDSNYKGVPVGRDYHPRIYFNFDCDETIECGKYLVGSIGRHVD